MNPVVLHGRSAWDQSRFPADERDERLRLVRNEMARKGLEGLVVFGHCVDYGNLCYLTQYVPMVGWSMVVVPVAGDPVLVVGIGGGRDTPTARTLTWIADVRTLPSLGGGLSDLLAELGITGRIGLAGAENSLPAGLCDEVVGALGEDLEAGADDLLAGLRRSLRPREITAVREAACIVQKSADEFIAAVDRGLANAAALVEADGAARKHGAHDFRGLVNLGRSGYLEPVTEPSSFRSDTVVAYLAASFAGYWAGMAITTGATDFPHLEHARRALGAMVDRVRAGTTAGDVAREGLAQLGAASAANRAEIGRLGFGCAKGLFLCGPPWVTELSLDLLVENSILGLHVRMDGFSDPGCVVSDMVLVTAEGCRSLLRPEFKSGA